MILLSQGRRNYMHEYLYYVKTKGALDESTYQTIRPQGSKPGRIYGLPKIHRDGNPLRPIVSSIRTYTYELSKFLADILKPLSKNQYTVRDSFPFANELLNLNDVHHMASFDVSSLFHLHKIKATSTFILRYNALIQTLQRSLNHE